MYPDQAEQGGLSLGESTARPLTENRRRGVGLVCGGEGEGVGRDDAEETSVGRCRGNVHPLEGPQARGGGHFRGIVPLPNLPRRGRDQLRDFDFPDERQWSGA